MDDSLLLLRLTGVRRTFIDKLLFSLDEIVEVKFFFSVGSFSQMRHSMESRKGGWSHCGTFVFLTWRKDDRAVRVS